MLKKAILFLHFFYILNIYLPAFIKDFGLDEIVDYKKYGYFENLDKEDYRYVIKSKNELILAQGEGIYPNTWTFLSDKKFIEYEKNGMLYGSRWSFWDCGNPELMYYKWSMSSEEDSAVRQFYIAKAFEKAGYIKHAIKAYYSILVFYPKYTHQVYSKKVIYIADVVIDKINYLLDKNIEINWFLDGTNIEIQNKFDRNLKNDVFKINPGSLVKKEIDFLFKEEDDKYIEDSKIKIEEMTSFKDLDIVKYQDGGFYLFLDNDEYFVKAVEYNCLKEKKFDNFQDDFAMMKAMGVNTIVVDFDDFKLGKDNIFKELENIIIRFNINPEKIDVFFDDIKEFILINSNEKNVFSWMLELRDYDLLSDDEIKNLYLKINGIVKQIKELDKNHPVVFSNDELFLLDFLAENLTDIDILNIKINRECGFGYSFWRDLRKYFKKPVIINYGSSCYSVICGVDSEDAQLFMHKNAWEDILKNKNKPCIGGIVNEWVDSWSKKGSNNSQDNIGDSQGVFLDFYIYPEWMGILSYNKDFSSPKHKRKVYEYYKKNWK